VKAKNYKEGDLFALPISPTGYAIGLVARSNPRNSAIIASFFWLRFDHVPYLAELKSIKPTDSIRILQIGDLGIINREWKVIGQIPGWERSEWTIPAFVRSEPISNRLWRVVYSDDDPSVVVSEELISKEIAARLDRNAVFGYGAVEREISKAILQLEE